MKAVNDDEPNSRNGVSQNFSPVEEHFWRRPRFRQVSSNALI
jgi:hypothetical protein